MNRFLDRVANANPALVFSVIILIFALALWAFGDYLLPDFP